MINNRVTILSISAVQSRMARAALSLGVRELAALAKVSPNTIARLERGEVLYARTLADVRSVLEAAGVVFLAPGETTDGGAGVRLAKDGPTMLDVAVVDQDGPKPDMPKAS